MVHMSIQYVLRTGRRLPQYHDFSIGGNADAVRVLQGAWILWVIQPEATNGMRFSSWVLLKSRLQVSGIDQDATALVRVGLAS